MFNRVNKLANEALNQSKTVAETMVGVSRAAAKGTAQLMFKAKKPLRDVARTSVRLNKISHQSVEKLVKVQAKAIERSVDAGAARLELAARAPTLKALINQQVSLMPETRKRLQGDLRNTWEIFVEAGTEIGSTFRSAKPAAVRKQAKRKSKSKKRATAVKRTAKKRAKTTKSTPRRVAKKTTRKARKAA